MVERRVGRNAAEERPAVEGEREAKRELTGFEFINVLNLCQHQKGVCR